MPLIVSRLKSLSFRISATGLFAFTLSPNLIFAQRVSFGFTGGVNLTRDFPSSRDIYFDPSYPTGLSAAERYSDGHGLIAGLSLEVDLGRGVSLEGNALRRQLHFKLRSIFPDGTVQEDGRIEIGPWEFPILLKYRMPSFRSIRPFLEAGPSFRTRHNPGGSEPSQVGATFGAGVEFHAKKLRISPAVRYTRWQYDGDFPRIATKRDQIEFVTGISYATSLPSWRVGGRKLRFGFMGGTPFTPGLEQVPAPQRLNEAQGYIAGLAVELEVNRRWCIEIDGLYRPFRADQISNPADFPKSSFEFTVLTWQFPMLGKYRFRPESKVRPFAEAGPSIRLSGNLNGYNPSRYGFTVGSGIETDYKAMRVAPVLRYTRWDRDERAWFMSADTARNQLEFLLSLTF
ncbi:MAG TPA: outer membrane beta-barrel protein [Bryobacteraceae bacterium]|nr:outer membrane beta-barrel protein [Bryobacteraceae bacterium]